MVTIKQILDKFNFNPSDRYGEDIEGVDIGNYSFDDFEEKDYIIEFTSKTNPGIILRINEEFMNVILLKILDEYEVEATSWINGKKYTKKFLREQMGV